MKRFFLKTFDVRPDERRLTLLMAINYALLLATFYMLKPARDSLFLVKLTPDQLPLVFIFSALATLPVAALYARAARRFGPVALTNGTTVFLIVNVAVMRYLVTVGGNWVFYVFYAWVGIYGILVTAQFWLLANAFYDATQAKRLFSLLGAAGIIGAFLGGEFTAFLVSRLHLGTENLLLATMGLLTLSVLIVGIVARLRRREPTANRTTRFRKETPATSIVETARTVTRSRLLLAIVALIAVAVMTSTFIDYVFKDICYREFAGDKQSLTAFFGTFYGRVSLVALAIQLLATYPLLRRFGVGGVLIFMPLAILGGNVAILLAPAFIGALLLKGSEGSLEYSLDRVGRELLFLPVSIQVKARVKILIDIFADRFFRGVAGIVLLILISVVAATTENLTLLIGGLVALWVAIGFFVRREYIDSFRRAMERHEIDLEDQRLRIDDDATLKALVNSLSSRNERQISYALELLKSARKPELVAEVGPLLKHHSPEVRRKALELLQEYHELADVNALLDDPDLGVRREAIYLLYLRAEPDRGKFLEEMLNHFDPSRQTAVLACIAEHRLPEAETLLDEERLETFLVRQDADAEAGRIEVARVMGVLSAEHYRIFLAQLLADPSVHVVRAAIAAVGHRRDADFVPTLYEFLADPRIRNAAKEALAEFGTSILPRLREGLLSEQTSPRLRGQIPSVVYRIVLPESVELLFDCAPQLAPPLRLRTIRALNKLRATSSRLKFAAIRVDELILAECESSYRYLEMLALLAKDSESAGTRLLIRAVSERKRLSQELIFRLLGLRFDSAAIYNAYLRVTGDQQDSRAGAMEYLSNILPASYRSRLLAVIEERDTDIALRQATTYFERRISNRAQLIGALLDGNDDWLKACAVNVLKRSEAAEVTERIRELCHDHDAIVRETALAVAAEYGY